jgi:hypothetical protein
MRLIRLRARARDDRGAVAVIVALLLVVLGGSAAVTFDLARLRHERHLVQAAVDLGSLAGAAFLPVSNPAGAAAAEGAARDIAIKNAPQLESGGLSLRFACVIYDPEGDGPGTSSVDYGFACGPNGGTGTWSNWVSRGGRAYHVCNPYAGDLCNTITVAATSGVDYFFAPLIGFDSGTTGAVSASACKGYCGQSSSPLDVVFVIDRTNSMSDADIANLKRAIVNTSPAEDSVLEFYDPSDVYIGLVALPYQDAANPCGVAQRQDYPKPVPPTANQAYWQVHGFSNDYRLDRDSPINPGSSLVQRIQCLQRAASTVQSYVSGASPTGRHTNHGDPLMAAQALLNQGRPDAPDVIIFFADGQANQPDPTAPPCLYAYNAAQNAKAAGTAVFALGYGVDTTTCNRDTTGMFRNVRATTFLAAVSGAPGEPPSTDDVPGGCGVNENKDGDYYFCESRGDDLRDVFKRIAIQSIQRSRLLNF